MPQCYSHFSAHIHVEGDAAAVRDYFSFSHRMDVGREKKWMGYEGKRSGFYVKDDGEWMMIGDFTVSNTDEVVGGY